MTEVDMEVAGGSEAIGTTRNEAAGEDVVEVVDGATSRQGLPWNETCASLELWSEPREIPQHNGIWK